MGFNILGVAIDNKFPDKEKLCQDLQIGNVVLVNENSLFENASSSYAMDDDAVFITETEKGTLVTFGTSIDFTTLKIKGLSENGSALLFVVGDTIGMYILFLAEKGKIVRLINYDGAKKISDKGNPMPIEEELKDISELIFHLIGKTIGTSFWDLEPDSLSLKFKKKSVLPG